MSNAAVALPFNATSTLMDDHALWNEDSSSFFLDNVDDDVDDFLFSESERMTILDGIDDYDFQVIMDSSLTSSTELLPMLPSSSSLVTGDNLFDEEKEVDYDFIQELSTDTTTFDEENASSGMNYRSVSPEQMANNDDDDLSQEETDSVLLKDQYQRTLLKLQNSMRRTDETRRLVKRQKIACPDETKNFFVSKKCQSLEKTRKQIYSYLTNIQKTQQQQQQQ